MQVPDPASLGPAPTALWSVAGEEHRWAGPPDGLVLIEIGCAAPPPPGAATLLVGGVALRPPTAALALGGAATPRLVFVARDMEGRLAPGARCSLHRGDAPVADFTAAAPIALEPLLLERDATERLALLRFLVATCAPLLGLARGASALGMACHRLAHAVAQRGGQVATALCRPGAALSLWTPPPGATGHWHLLDRGGLRRLAATHHGIQVIEGPPPSAGALLLPPRDGAAPIRFAPVGPELPSLQGSLTAALTAPAPAPPPILAALARHAVAHRRTAALLREAQLLAPAQPRRITDPVSPIGGAIELALSDDAGGVFLCGWLRDPLGLVAGLELRSAFARVPVPQAALHHVARPDLEAGFAGTGHGSGSAAPGFLAHLPDADHPAVAQWRLALRLGSGEALDLVAPPARLRPEVARDLVLRAVHPGALRPGLLEHCIAPAAARLHAAAMAPAGPPEIIRLGGTPPRRPRVAVIVPLYRNLRFLRFQLAAFARDPTTRAAEIVYVLDSPEQRGMVEHALRGLAALHGDLALTLVVMPANRGYASACNAGAAASSAPVLALLNSDVLPAAPGWLDALLGRLRRDRRLAAVGPKLLFEDGAIQHAGLLFRRGEDGAWLNDHYFKGFARHTPAACVARRVPAVTGAALVVRRAAFEAVGGFSTDYIIGDFEDSELCLALQAAGHAIGYEPAAELFHFERQSIAEHAGHHQTLAGAYNRALHHRRWDATITALMPRHPEPG